MNMTSLSALPARPQVRQANIQRSNNFAAPAQQPAVQFAGGDIGQGFADAFKVVKALVIGAFIVGVGGALGAGYLIGGCNSKKDNVPAAIQKTDDAERIKQLEAQVKELQTQQKDK